MRFIFTLFLFMTAVLPTAQADNNTLQIDTFSKIPILHNGRVKPIESFAKAVIKPITGSNNNAVEHLIKLIFNPARSEYDPIIKISHRSTIAFLKLKKQKDKHYSYEEVLQALSAQEKNIQSIVNAPPVSLTPAQKELVHLYDQALIIRDILGSLVLFAPLSNIDWEQIPTDMKPTDTSTFNYLSFTPFKEKIHNTTRNIARNKGVDIGKYTLQEQNIAALSYALAELEKPVLYSDLFKVISATQSPWNIIRDNQPYSPVFNLWKESMIAYQNGDWAQWNTLIEDIYQQSEPSSALTVETLYNQIQPFYLSALLYGLVMILLMLQSFVGRANLNYPAFLILSAGCLLHIIGIGMRVYILQRPPVSTLYESILFVGLIAAVYGVTSFYRHKDNPLPLIIGSSLGVILYILAYFNDTSGDTLLMLSAVLNTNFWLATHVLVITAGYGFCLITSGFAYYALIKRDTTSPLLMQNIKKAALWSLLLCTLGTILGGVWADQSWGRFWGWDPKENGALLIVLWLIWLLHGKISKQINPVFFVAGMAYLSVIVALSWFGVNLLSIGLHAYGFTDSALYWLITFIVSQTALIAFLIRRNNAH